ncbi:30S ribosomal protein S12 methylthiotransferase RimO [candidate division KSB1 bacterium]|nr:30S ribosomal protein S12 methylthiotransferase RimO [candidate division KSB1 bacterium]
MRVALITLGCPKNTVDSEMIKGALESESVVFTDETEQAEIIIVNTCGFIQSAKEEAIETILQAAQFKESGECSKVFVTGCLVTRYRDELISSIPEVDGFIENRNIPKVIQQLGKQAGLPVCQHPKRSLLTPTHYAYLKIAEGCNNRCSYCAIPMIRGSFRSFPLNSIEQEAERLVRCGIKELILIAQDTTLYGDDLHPKTNLATLLNRLSDGQLPPWIRLMYTHPAHYSDELIDVVASRPEICKYLDLPLQHISDPILKAMGRKVTRKEIEQLIQKLRDRIPGLAIRTSFIVGFPGESDSAFSELLEFVAEMQFDRLGAFTYSPEEGTPAYEMPGQVPDKLKNERLEQLLTAQAEISLQQNMALINSEFDVLIDEYESDSGFFVGRTSLDAPEIDNSVLIRDSSCKIGKFNRIKIIDAFEFDLIGQLISN